MKIERYVIDTLTIKGVFETEFIYLIDTTMDIKDERRFILLTKNCTTSTTE